MIEHSTIKHPSTLDDTCQGIDVEDRVYLRDLPNELLCLIVDLLPHRDGLALSMTSHSMKERILPRIYVNDAKDYAREGVPLGLQFGCWYGVSRTFDMSFAAIQQICLSPGDVVNRLLDVTKLDSFGSKRGIVTTEDYGLVPIYPMTNKPLFTMLHLCSLRGTTAIAQTLITAGAEVGKTDTKGNTSICYAANESVARFLLQHGAQINGALEKNKQGPLVSLIRIHYLQLHGWTAAPSKWYNTARGVSTGGALNAGDMTPNCLSTIRYLVKAGVEVSPKVNDPRRLPLAHAIHCRQSEIVKLLLDAGANPNPAYIINGRIETYLLLTEAIYYSTPEISQLLFDAGADVDETPGSSLEAPLMVLSCHAIREDEFLSLAGMICLRMGDINRPMNGHPSLWWAIKNGRFKIAKTLIQNGATCGQKGVFLRAKVVGALLEALVSAG